MLGRARRLAGVAVSIALIVAAGLPAGFLIGTVGIGGVILVPLLVGVGGMDPRDAAQISLAGFIVTGAAALVRPTGFQMRTVLTVALPAIPGAVLGAILLRHVPPQLVVWLVVALVCLSTAPTLFKPGSSLREAQQELPPVAGAGIGMITGAGSALSGTGGPLVLIPLLMLMRVDIRQCVRLAQAIQLPVAIAATATNLGYATLDVPTAATLALALLFGVWIGWVVEPRVSKLWLTRAATAAVLAATAIMIVSAGRTG